jgi:uncharacterized protein (TIGR02611 family)
VSEPQGKRTVLRDPGEDDDWAWRRAIRANPRALLVYRVLVGIVGLFVTLLGLFLVPLPGPGWLVVIAGLLILASEFDWAHSAVQWLKARLSQWNAWVRRQPVLVQATFALLTAAVVLAVLWTTLKVSGLPGLIPPPIADWMHRHLSL